jgi:hypothetical protein
MPGYADPFGASGATTTTPAAPAGLDPSQWEDWYLNNVPEAGWIRYLQGQGLFGINPQARYAQNQYGRTYGSYTAAAATNPNLGFYDWIKGSGLDLGGEFASQSPEQRGDFTDRTLTPRARFMRAY